MRGKRHLYRGEERTITWPHCARVLLVFLWTITSLMVLTMALKWWPQHSGSTSGPLTPSLNGFIYLPLLVNINIVIFYQCQDVKTFGKPELMDSKIHKVSISYCTFSHPYVLDSILNFKHIRYVHLILSESNWNIFPLNLVLGDTPCARTPESKSLRSPAPNKLPALLSIVCTKFGHVWPQDPSIKVNPKNIP